MDAVFPGAATAPSPGRIARLFAKATPRRRRASRPGAPVPRAEVAPSRGAGRTAFAVVPAPAPLRYAGSLRADSLGPALDAHSRRKRALDITGALLLLLLGLPVLLGIALAVRLSSPGPVLFRQPRTGLNGVTFRCLKFRTMRAASTDLLAERQTVEGDPRITPVGRWLRRLSFDELPQLVNVLRGEMSLVGPRPHAPATKAAGRLFHEVVPGYENRHVVRPGITGLAQVSGCRGPTGLEAQIIRRVQFDMLYIENMSVALDLRILWATVTREIFSGDAF